MKPVSIRLLAGMASLCAVSAAHAAITCTVPTSTGFSTAISAQAAPNDSAVPNITQGTVTFNCSRSAAGDPLVVYLRANNGANALGTQNRVRRGASRLNYEAYKDSSCGAVWTSLIAADFIVVNLANIVSPPNPAQNFSINFWGCVPLGQIGAAAGAYTDTVTMRVVNATGAVNYSANGTFTVTVTNPASCTIPTLPGDISFTYTAFSPQQTANTTFAANCTNLLPYTLSLDSYFGNLNGVHYDLDINGTAPAAVDARGTGGAQNYTINATVPGNQAGTCATAACPAASKTHTLTVTY